MSTIGYATLDVIPSMKGLRSALEKGSSADFAAVGKSGGKKFGDAAGKEAGTSFKSKIGGALKDFNPLAGLAIGAGVVAFLKGSMDEARDAAKVSAQTTSVLTATGGAAKVTSAEISNLAGALSAKIGVDDEAIQSGENLLLTFKNIKNEVGAGNDVFNQATTALLDVSSAMGQDIKSSAIQLGKALNDPVKGMTAMARVGVTFTDQQKAQAKAMVASGDVIGAQKIILAELSSEFGGAAAAGHDAGDQLGVAFGNMQEALGTALLPSLANLADVTTTKVIPALTTAGGVVGDAVGLFKSLPGPVQLAAAAFVALRLAAAAGIGTSIAAGVAGLTGTLVGLRLRIMFAGDAFATARLSSGRFQASLAGVRAAAIGAGAALKGVLISTGWGVALIAATTLLTQFWAAQQQAKQRVEDLTAALDQQTGSVTKAARDVAFKNLQDQGAVDIANKYGISLDLVRKAAFGNAAALGQVNAAMQAQVVAASSVQGGVTRLGRDAVDASFDAKKLSDALGDSNTELAQARDGLKSHAAFMGTDATETGKATGAFRDYAAEADKARTAIHKLLAAEDKRRDAFSSQKADQLSLIESLQAARKEANKGKKTLDENTHAGQENWHALLDLADQWNNQKPKVQGARGEYAKMRQSFIDVAEQMGKTKAQAERLADKILEVPKTAKMKFQSEGFKDRMRELKELRDAQRAIADGLTFNFGAAPHGFGATEPTNQNLTPNHHGNRQNDRTTTNPRGGVNINIGTVVAHDYDDLMGKMQHKSQQASLDGVSH